MSLRSIQITLSAGLFLTAISLSTADEKRQILSIHKTVAVFTGTLNVKCKGRTALCPERCGHSGTYSTFSIKKYLEYMKPGENADPKQENIKFKMDGKKKAPGLSKKILSVIEELEAGDPVLLAWTHEYVTNDSISSPERVFGSLERLSPEKVAELLGIQPGKSSPRK